MSPDNETKRLVSGPRVKALVIGPHEFQGCYKQHDLDLLRDGLNGNWYIRVRAPNGCYAYDGWWACSRGKPVKAAVAEACRGAGLWAPSVVAQRRPLVHTAQNDCA